MSSGYQLSPHKAVYSAAPVKTAATPSTLRAYNIDLSIRIDEVREADAYRPKAAPLPVIFKPSTLERRSKSSDGLTRRRTFGAADEAKTWYSSSCDGPKGGVKKPSVLHVAAPVDVDIPFIDEDPPPKPLRSLFATPVFIGDEEEQPKKPSNYHSLPRPSWKGKDEGKFDFKASESILRARPLQLDEKKPGSSRWQDDQLGNETEASGRSSGWKDKSEDTVSNFTQKASSMKVPSWQNLRPDQRISPERLEDTPRWQDRTAGNDCNRKEQLYSSRPIDASSSWRERSTERHPMTSWRDEMNRPTEKSSRFQETKPPEEKEGTFSARLESSGYRNGSSHKFPGYKAAEPEENPSWQKRREEKPPDEAQRPSWQERFSENKSPKNLQSWKLPDAQPTQRGSQSDQKQSKWMDFSREKLPGLSEKAMEVHDDQRQSASWQKPPIQKESPQEEVHTFKATVWRQPEEPSDVTPFTVEWEQSKKPYSCQQKDRPSWKPSFRMETPEKQTVRISPWNREEGEEEQRKDRGEQQPQPTPSHKKQQQSDSPVSYQDLPDISRNTLVSKPSFPQESQLGRPKRATEASETFRGDTVVTLDTARIPRHLREDSGFKEGEDADEEEDFDWGDEELNKAARRRRSSLVLRTQTSLRVKTIIDKLLSASGRDQRRALFSLKQIFQDDKDLVHEFVQDGGLDCMIRLGRVADQNHQNYILRALGQLMLYVDGMNGIIAHNATIQWLYELLDSPFRLVVKTALKLLLVFIEYNDNNALLVLAAVTSVDRSKGQPDWTALMKVVAEKDCPDPETIVYGLTVINKALHGIPDRDTYYDAVDSLDALGMEEVMSRLQKTGNREIAEQCKLYERELNQEDADSEEDVQQNNAKMRKTADDKRTKMRQRAAEALRQQEEQRANFGANREMFVARTEETKENRPTIPVETEKKSTLPWRNGTEQPKEQNGDAVAPATPKKIPEPLKLQPENQENEKPEESEEEHKVKAPPPSFPTIFSPTEAKTMEFPDPVPPPPKETEPEKPAPPKAKIVKDDGGGGFAAMLQKRAAKASESNANSFAPKESEGEQQWRKAAENLKSRPLIINDLDFSKFHNAEFEQDPLVMARLAQVAQSRAAPPMGGGIPPPPPPGGIPLPPRLQGIGGPPPPPPPPGAGPPPPPPPNMLNLRREASPGPGTASKGVLKLHWKPAAVEPPPVPSLRQKGTFWNGLDMPSFDPGKLVQLFETKQQKEVAVKKPTEAKAQTLQVLNTKRSQAINIGLTKLPPVNVIPTAILKFDSLVLNKEGIEKILKEMMPSTSEIEEIQNKAAENPDMQLGTAEQFLLKLSGIPCLLERLKLWIFTLDYKNIEKDIAEPLMDLQLAMKEMEESKTFRKAMAMLLAIGNSLSGTEIKGFYLDYLAKASEVKDPVYKHTLTHHLAEYMIEHFPDSSDLYSEFGAVARSSRVDFKDILENLQRLEKECKSSWEYLGKISKNDNSSMRVKINDYLVDVAERIHQLKDIHRIAINRWHGFLLYFGYTVQEIPGQNPNEVFKMVTEFALEYRTTRDKILQNKKRQAEKRERNKTRGKMWASEAQQNMEVTQKRRIPAPITAEERHDELSKVLNGLSEGDGTLRRRGVRPSVEKAKAPDANGGADGDSPDDEILNSLAKAATLPTEARDHRRRARQFNRKSLRRTRTLKLVDGQIETY